ncbi:MAG: beta-lactamase family protein [Clostridia bacterium]|nr:beta-lactamase family protein [Clostridia bacterium]
MIQKVLDTFVQTGAAAGTSLLVFKDGREAFFGCAGRLDLDQPAPFARDAIMRMFSMTKVVTAAAIMTLADQGLLSVNDPVSRFIPEYANLMVAQPDGTLVPADKPLTIRHLLTMTSGIPYPGGSDVVSQAYAREMASFDWANDTTLDMARIIARCPLCFHPGDEWRYGLSADVLGAVVVAITGMELGEYLKKTIFDPLGMVDTAFTVPEEKKHRMAVMYNVSPEGGWSPVPAKANSFGARVEMGGAGLYSTLDDFVRFGEMLRVGGKEILSEESIREMSRNQLTPKQMETFWETGIGYGYGYLVRTVIDESLNELHAEPNGVFGWNGMAGTSLRIDPANGLTVVYGIQRVPANHDDFLPPVLQAVAHVFRK